MLLKRFPRNGFFNFGNMSKAGGLMSGLYGGWGSTCHPYLAKISDTAPEAWGGALMYDRWSLRKIWLQTVLLLFQGPVLQNRDHVACQYAHIVLTQLSRKWERLHHLTGRAIAVCRTFEMAYVTALHKTVFVVTIWHRKTRNIDTNTFSFGRVSWWLRTGTL